MTPIGVSVDVPSPLIEGIELPLAFRPDLLKAAVGGTITGVGLDPTRSDDAYGTALIIKVSTGETLGFQLVAPAGAAPVPYSVPYDPAAVDPNADYVARGSMWDGTTLWAMDAGVPVITKDNARTDVVLTVTEAVTPGASPSAAPPAPAPPARARGAGPQQRAADLRDPGPRGSGPHRVARLPPLEERLTACLTPRRARDNGVMESWAGVLILLAVLAIVGILRATSDPSRVIGGMWRYRAPDWPSGVQEDDDAHWSWSNAAQASRARG